MHCLVCGRATILLNGFCSHRCKTLAQDYYYRMLLKEDKKYEQQGICRFGCYFSTSFMKVERHGKTTRSKKKADTCAS